VRLALLGAGLVRLAGTPSRGVGLTVEVDAGGLGGSALLSSLALLLLSDQLLSLADQFLLLLPLATVG
jgi:hypothetical protein